MVSSSRTRGGISVESYPEKGSTFRIVFPAVAVPPDLIEEKDENIRQKGSEKVLLVEDDAIVRDLAERMLTRLGYTAVTADSGEEAVRLFIEDPDRFDLLLTDVIMPGMDGNEIWNRMSERRPGLRVLYMSGYLDDTIAERGILREGVHLVRKPFSLEQLSSHIRETLDSDS